jgi:hypothetical protein
MADKKFTNHDVKVIINNEGIGYAIQHYCSYKDIKDKQMSDLWKQARNILIKIEKLAGNSEESEYDQFS